MNLSGLLLRRCIPELSQSSSTLMSPRTIHALAVLLILVQLPHLLHLPVWVSVVGAWLVLARLQLLRNRHGKVLRILLSPVSVTLMAAGSAFLIKADYGYFIGRDPSVAFLFILVAAKFAEVRRAGDATLLLCLAAFLLLTQYFYSQNILAACITLPAVIALAYVLAVLRDPDNPATTPEQLKLVGKLLVHGVPLAAVLFMVFPRLPGPLWSLPEDAMATTGLSDSMSPGSIGKLSQSDAVAFRVEFDGSLPPINQRYWRGPVLSEFDGRNWSTSKVMIEATPQYRGNTSDVVNYTVMLQPHNQRWLFALESAVSLPRSDNRVQTGTQTPSNSPALGRIMNDGQIIATQPVSQVLRYQQQSVLSNAIQTSGYPNDNTLFLPGKNTQTQRFASTLRKSVDTNAQYAERVMQHFNIEPFHYTLSPQLLGDTPVDEFLFDTRAGFCEHYAAAFVVMMRSAGIPARVVTGYLGGQMNGDYMIVRQSDAHAWAEAWIDGAWRRFDPTGAVAPSRVEQGISAALPDELSVPRLARMKSGWLNNAQLRWDAMNHHWQRLVVDFDDSSQDRLWERLGIGKPALWQVTLFVLLLATGWSVLILGIPGLKRKETNSDERLWQALCRKLSARSIIRGASETPTEYLHRAALSWPDQAQRLMILGECFSQLRFQKLDDATARTQRKLIRRTLRGLRRGLYKRSLKPQQPVHSEPQHPVQT